MVGVSAAPSSPVSTPPPLKRRPDDFRRVMREAHLENMGVYDFLGMRFDSVSMAAADDDEDAEIFFGEFQRQIARIGGATRHGGSQGNGGAFVTVIKAYVGIGILSLPYAISCGGYVAGPVCLAILAWMSYRCILKLIAVAYNISDKLYLQEGNSSKKSGGSKTRFSQVDIEMGILRGESPTRTSSNASGNKNDTKTFVIDNEDAADSSGEDDEESDHEEQFKNEEQKIRTPPKAEQNAQIKAGAPRKKKRKKSKKTYETIPQPTTIGVGGGSVSTDDGVGFATNIASRLSDDMSSSSDKLHPDLSYGVIAYEMLGSLGKLIVDFSIISTQVGFCIAYLIFMPENIRKVLCMETKGEMCPSQGFLTTLIVLLLCPLIWMKSIAALQIPVMAATLALCAGIGWGYMNALGMTETESYNNSTAVKNIMVLLRRLATEKVKEQMGDKHGGADTEVSSLGLVPINYAQFPIFFGIGVFAFEGIGMILPIMNGMSTPGSLPTVLKYATLFLTTLYCSFGTICYLAYGENVSSMITFNYANGKTTSLIILFYVFGIFFSFPLAMFPVFQLIEKLACVEAFFLRVAKMDMQMDETALPPPIRRRHSFLMQSFSVTLFRCAFRFLITATCAVAATLIPHFGLFLSLMGCLSCNILAYILPGFLHMRCFPNQTPREDRFYVWFGILAGIWSFQAILREMFEESED